MYTAGLHNSIILKNIITSATKFSPRAHEITATKTKTASDWLTGFSLNPAQGHLVLRSDYKIIFFVKMFTVSD